ncbi:MAG: hypothetical protein KDE23_02375, partial [Caldilinea sp.]|nr:hypothetical protein [Caldilinea sp.]
AMLDFAAYRAKTVTYNDLVAGLGIDDLRALTNEMVDTMLDLIAGCTDADVTFHPDVKREAIIDSWPADIDDSAARMDWEWAPEYDADRAFSDYLIPRIKERYTRP